MSEPKPKGWKRVYTVVAGIFTAIGLAAGWTASVDAVLPKWLAWLPFLGRILPSVLAWLFWLVLIYCTTALCLIGFREWREGTKARKEAKRAELKRLAELARWLIREAEWNFGPPEKRDSVHDYEDFRDALDQFEDALVQGREYEYRLTLYTTLRNLERQCLSDPAAIKWEQLNPFLKSLQQWAEFAEAEVNPEVPPRPRDPLGPSSRQ